MELVIDGGEVTVFGLGLGTAVGYTVNLRGGWRVDGGQKIISCNQNNTIKISTATKLMLLFPMLNSVLVVKMNIKLKTYYSNTAVRYTSVPNTIKRCSA